MDANLERRVVQLESLVETLLDRSSNSIGRATLKESDDSGGMQSVKASGFADEELDGVQVWQPFGLSANCPPGGDALLLSMGGNREGAQALMASHSSIRPTGTETGGTVLYDGMGNKITLGSGGIVIESSGPVSIKAAGSLTIDAVGVEITSETLTHNGVNVGDDHKHIDVSAGAATSGVPET